MLLHVCVCVCACGESAKVTSGQAVDLQPVLQVTVWIKERSYLLPEYTGTNYRCVFSLMNAELDFICIINGATTTTNLFVFYIIVT